MTFHRITWIILTRAVTSPFTIPFLRLGRGHRMTPKIPPRHAGGPRRHPSAKARRAGAKARPPGSHIRRYRIRSRDAQSQTATDRRRIGRLGYVPPCLLWLGKMMVLLGDGWPSLVPVSPKESPLLTWVSTYDAGG